MYKYILVCTFSRHDKIVLAPPYRLVEALEMADADLKIHEAAQNPKTFLYLTDAVFSEIQSTPATMLSRSKKWLEAIACRKLLPIKRVHEVSQGEQYAAHALLPIEPAVLRCYSKGEPNKTVERCKDDLPKIASANYWENEYYILNQELLTDENRELLVKYNETPLELRL